MKKILVLLLVLLSSLVLKASEQKQCVLVFSDSAAYNEYVAAYERQELSADNSPNPFYRKLFKVDASGKSKTVAAILAFPITGITGVHRVYLGTKAYVPVVYVGMLGGCLGILPFIDFVVILVEKDLTPYENNGKVFMWMK